MADAKYLKFILSFDLTKDLTGANIPINFQLIKFLRIYLQFFL